MNRACESLSLLMCTLACCITATDSKAAEAATPQNGQRGPVYICTIPINQCNHDGPECVEPGEKYSDEIQNGLPSETIADDLPASDDAGEYVDEDYSYDEDYYGDYGDGYGEAATKNETIQSDSETSHDEAIEDMELRSGHDEVYDDAVYGDAGTVKDHVAEHDSVEDEGHVDDVQYDYDSDFDYEGNWYDGSQTADIEQTSDEDRNIEEYQPYDYDSDDYDSYDYDQYWYDQVEDDCEREVNGIGRVVKDARQRESIADQMMDRLHSVADLPRKAVDYVMQSKDQLSPSIWYSHVVGKLQQVINESAANRSLAATPTIERDALDADFGFADEYGDHEWDCFCPDSYSKGTNKVPAVVTPTPVKAESDEQQVGVSLRYDRAVMISIAKILDHTGSSLRHVSQQLTRVAQADVDLVEAKASPQEGVEQR